MPLSRRAPSIDFMIYTFTYTKNWGEWLKIKEELAVAIMDIIEKGGTGFAFPSRTIYMQQQDPPEIMAPPARSETVERTQREMAELERTRGIGEADDDG
jgi:MscS family membrane protein